MKLFILHLLCLVISVNYVFSQETESNTINKNSGEYFRDNFLRIYNGSSGGFWTKGNSYSEKLEGTPYLYKGWDSSMELRTEDNKVFKVNNCNYDVTEDVFVAKMSKDSLFKFDNNNVKIVKTKDKIFKKINNSGTEMFLEVLLDDENVAFLKKYYKTIKKGKINPMTRELISKDRYFDANEFYFLKKDKLIKIKLSKKSILTNLKDKKKIERLNKYCKENKLKYRLEKDVVKILNYYNSL